MIRAVSGGTDKVPASNHSGNASFWGFCQSAVLSGCMNEYNPECCRSFGWRVSRWKARRHHRVGVNTYSLDMLILIIPRGFGDINWTGKVFFQNPEWVGNAVFLDCIFYFSYSFHESFEVTHKARPRFRNNNSAWQPNWLFSRTLYRFHRNHLPGTINTCSIFNPFLSSRDPLPLVAWKKRFPRRETLLVSWRIRCLSSNDRNKKAGLLIDQRFPALYIVIGFYPAVLPDFLIQVCKNWRSL